MGCYVKEVDGQFSCSRCQSLRRPCTWTTDDMMRENDWDGLTVIPKSTHSPMDIPDRSVVEEKHDADLDGDEDEEADLDYEVVGELVDDYLED